MSSQLSSMRSDRRLAMIAIVVFWTASFAAAVIDYVGERWFGISWSISADLFPNGVLGYPLAFAQVGAAGILVYAAIRYARRRQTVWGWIIGPAMAAITGFANFAVFVICALYYHAAIMGRSM